MTSCSLLPQGAAVYVLVGRLGRGDVKLSRWVRLRLLVVAVRLDRVRICFFRCLEGVNEKVYRGGALGATDVPLYPSQGVGATGVAVDDVECPCFEMTLLDGLTRVTCRPTGNRLCGI